MSAITKHMVEKAAEKLSDAAFPIVLDERGIEVVVKGLTKREWFAGMALQGFLASDLSTKDYTNKVISWSVVLADALIEKLNGTKGDADISGIPVKNSE